MRLPYRTIEDKVAADVAIVGIPFDTAASFRTGQRFGPSAIRDISVLLRPSNQFHQLRATDTMGIVDLGDVSVVPGDVATTHQRCAETWQDLATRGVTPIGLGGDHSITLGELRGLARHHGPVALVQMDAHCDTWDNYWGLKYTHGTCIRRACEEGLIDTTHSIQVGMRGSEYAPGDLEASRDLGFEVLTSDDISTLGPAGTAQRLLARTAGHKSFLSFDIDFFDPAFAPGTGTPEVGGPSSSFGLEVVRRLGGVDFIGYDLVEVLPSSDVSGITALLGATVVFECLALAALGHGRR